MISSPIPVGREEAQEAARRELARPEYDRESWTEWLIRTVNDWLADLQRSTGVAGGWWALILLVVLIVGLVLLVRWRTGKIARSRTKPAVFGAEELSAEGHRAAAEEHARAGRWAEAIQERFRAIARELEERVIVEPMPGRTADELAAAVTTVELRPAARLFDDVTYGGRPGTSGQYAEISETDQQVRMIKATVSA